MEVYVCKCTCCQSRIYVMTEEYHDMMHRNNKVMVHDKQWDIFINVDKDNIPDKYNGFILINEKHTLQVSRAYYHQFESKAGGKPVVGTISHYLFNEYGDAANPLCLVRILLELDMPSAHLFDQVLYVNATYKDKLDAIIGRLVKK